MSLLLFNEEQPTPLCEIMGKYKCAKGSRNILTSHHNYTTLYHYLFKDWRDKPLRLFELGVGTNNVNFPSNMGKDAIVGASLYGWRDYFQKAQIYSADIDPDCLFNVDRIKTYYCDQRDPTVVENMLNNYSDLYDQFDIIIDNGLQMFEDKASFFNLFIKKLSPNGYYIIEDIINNEIQKYLNQIDEWKPHYPYLKFRLVTIPSNVNQYDNTLLIVQFGELKNLRLAINQDGSHLIRHPIQMTPEQMRQMQEYHQQQQLQQQLQQQQKR
jgi:hypothetical protein